MKERKNVRTYNVYSGGRRGRRAQRPSVTSLAPMGTVLVFLTLAGILMLLGAFYIGKQSFDTPSAEQFTKHTGSFPGTTVVNAVEEPTPTPTPTEKPNRVFEKFVVLDPGHGGRQPGCVVGDILEKDITMSVTSLLQEKLEEQGIGVIMTREADDDISLSDRSKIANESGAVCFVSIHCNSFESDTSVHGLECYYFRSSEGQNLADCITLSVSNNSIVTRRVKEENYAVLRDTKIPATLIEIGYMTNKEELKSLLSPEHQNRLAESIAEGIIKSGVLEENDAA